MFTNSGEHQNLEQVVRTFSPTASEPSPRRCIGYIHHHAYERRMRNQSALLAIASVSVDEVEGLRRPRIKAKKVLEDGRFSILDA
jgi:hypothetical protein